MLSTVIAAGGADGLDIGRILLELALILGAAKLIAELAERVGVPAVLGEILAGVLIGPSVLGLVEPSDSLFLLAELGAILLLMQVGMEVDIGELRSVGRSALTVAIIGVSLPLILGSATGLALGESGNTALFIGATLTATSVGITARVFGDLRALSTREARVVLGAAVADDVLGLIILTIVTRVVEEGTIGVGTIATTSLTAFSFLAIASAVGFTAVPRLIGYIAKKASSPAAVSVVAVGIALAYSGVADASKLAPIIGAFVAGAALGKAPAHERIARDVSAVAALFVPIFFLQIGIETDIASMFRPSVLGIAATLIAVAVVTKVVAGWGAGRNGGDRFLIGLGMMPRGEVGLIFATIGMGVGVFDDDLHAALVLVVLATTVISPAALRWRINSKGPAEVDLDIDAEPEPEGAGWPSSRGASPSRPTHPHRRRPTCCCRRRCSPATTNQARVSSIGSPNGAVAISSGTAMPRQNCSRCCVTALRGRGVFSRWQDSSTARSPRLQPPSANARATCRNSTPRTCCASPRSKPCAMRLPSRARKVTPSFLRRFSPTSVLDPTPRRRFSGGSTSIFSSPARSKTYSTARRFCAPRSNTNHTASTRRCCVTLPTVCGDPESSNAVDFWLTRSAASNHGNTPR